MTAHDLRDRLVAMLAKRAGGTPRRWRLVIGQVRLHDPATHPHCNWSVEPTGSASEIDAVERLLDDVRLTHPIVTAG